MQLLNDILNKALSLDPDLTEKLATFAGKSLAIHLTDVNFQFYILITPSGLMLTTEPQTATAKISGNSFNVLAMGFSSTTDTVAAMQKKNINIEGDLDFGMDIKRLLASAQIDWEEQLSYLTGDVIAYQLSQHLSDSKRWLASFHQRMQNNVKEYIQEEARISPTRAEFDDWLNDLDLLRMATDRIEARFVRLQQRLAHD